MTAREIIEAFSCPEPNTGCWLWERALDGGGYGMLTVRRVSYRAHRLSFLAFHGPIESCVLHRCDTRACVNPEHLFAGTKRDNNDDKTAKGRTPHGVDHYRAQLTPSDVVEIRAKYGAGDVAQRELGDEYAVSRETIRAVIRRQTWKHVE